MKSVPVLSKIKKNRAIYIFNHLEYDSDTLRQEYDRDLASGRDPEFPENYFPNDDPTKAPLNRWRSHGHLYMEIGLMKSTKRLTMI